MMRPLLWISLALFVAPWLAGCVSQGEADRYNALYRKSQEQVAELKSQLDEARARNRALMNQQQAAPQVTSSGDAERAEQLYAENQRLAAALADMEAQLRSMAATGPVLPPELDNQLMALAATNPDLMTYDPDRGMVKFRSDLTFALGSAEVKSGAQSSLKKLASIISSPAATSYEARIVGHTDNVPIKKGPTKLKHPTNWHLSVHRAIAVKDILEQSGVPPMRMNVAGYGEYRPVVPNGARGSEANRRVEVYLVPSTANATAMSNSNPAPAPQPVNPAVQEVEVIEQPAQQPQQDNDALFK